MSPHKYLFFTLIVHIFLFQHRCLALTNTSPVGKNSTSTGEPRLKCKQPKTVQEERYFRKLSSKKNDLRERNRVVYAEFPFYRTTWVLGWTMRGKTGKLRGGIDATRRGIITEYVILFLNHDGKWNFINNSRTGTEVFWNEGNLANPDSITEVDLAIPVQTNMLRVFPQLWEGTPYVRMNINYCQEPDPTPPASQVSTPPASQVPKNRSSSLRIDWSDQAFGSETSSVSSVSYPAIMGTTDPSVPKILSKNLTRTQNTRPVPTISKGRQRSDQTFVDRKESKSSSKDGKTDFVKLFTSNDSNTSKTKGGKAKPGSSKVSVQLSTTSSPMSVTSPGVKSTVPVEWPSSSHSANKQQQNMKTNNSPKISSGSSETSKTNATNKKAPADGISKDKPSTKHRSKGEPSIIQPQNVGQSQPKMPSQKVIATMEKIAITFNNASRQKYDHTRLTCKGKSEPDWRYETSSVFPNDIFSSADDIFHAWRGMFKASPVPYKFNISRNGMSKTNMQVSFTSPVKIYSVRIHGQDAKKDGGKITKFAFLHKLGNEDWHYYKDKSDKPGVFDMGKQKESSAGKPVIFKLPVPVKVTDIRIIPEKWIGEPYLALDFKTCDLVDRSEEKKCWESLLGKEGKMTLLSFSHLSSKMFFKNKKYVEITFAHKVPAKVMGIKVIPPMTEGKTAKSAVSIFVLEYMDANGKWRIINGQNDKAKLFSVKAGKEVRFDSPVEALSLRMFPQKWKGTNPEILIDVRGCLPKYRYY